MAPAPSPLDAPLRRERRGRVLAGVCAGMARRLGVDPLVPRVAIVALSVAGGVGIPLYLIAWAVLPAAPLEEGATPRRRRTGRAAIEVGAGVGLLVLSAMLALRATGVWFADVLAAPLVLVAAGGALLWRQSLADPVLAPATRSPEPARSRPAAAVSRTGVGVALVAGAGLLLLQGTGALTAARDVLLGIVVAGLVLGVVLAPWLVRLGRSLAAERAERIRSQERAEVAAHLHDSVLQTLALVQRRVDEPAAVAALARRQERELRAWLADRPGDRPEDTLRGALETAAAEVERDHNATIEVVAVGEHPLDERAQALAAAAREAMVNAAKFAPGAPVDVFAEAADGRVAVFVRDRGPGFDPAALPPDRRGVRESIVGRMARNGGRATIAPAPGGGTEVELVLETAASA